MYTQKCSYIITKILYVWQPIEASHWSIPEGFAIGPSLSAMFDYVCLYCSGLPPCISAMMLVALQNNSFIDV